jgi:hypothetical protein
MSPSPSIVVRYGLPGAPKVADLIQRVEKLGAGRALWLARSQPRRRELELAWLESRGAGSRGLYATLSEWVSERYDRLPGRKPTIGDAEQARLMQRLLIEEAGADSDHPFRQADRRFGLVQRFRQLVANLKQEGARSSRDAKKFILKMMAAGEGLAAYLSEPVTNVFDAYQRELHRLGLVDDEDKFFDVEDALAGKHAQGNAWLGPAPEVLVLEGWYQLSGVFQRILRELVQKCGETVVLMDGAFPEDLAAKKTALPEGAADAVYREEVAFWRKLGARFERRDGREVNASFRTALRALSRREAFAVAQNGNARLSQEAPTPHFAAKRHDSTADELRWIARRVTSMRREAAAAGKRAPRVAVLYPSLEGPAALAEEIFPRYGVPYRIIDRVALSATAPARLLRELMEMLLRRFPRPETMALFLSPLVCLDEIGTREELARFDLLLRRARFHGGRGVKHWRERLARWQTRALRDEEKLLEMLTDASAGQLADLIVEVENEREANADLEKDEPQSFAAEDALAEFVRAKLGLPGGPTEGDGDIAAGWTEQDDEHLGPRQAFRDWLDLHDRLALARTVGARLIEKLAEWEKIAEEKQPLDLAENLIAAYKGLRIAECLRDRADKAMEDWEASPLSERLIQRDLRAWRLAAKTVGETGRLLALESPKTEYSEFVRQVAETTSAEELPAPGFADPEEVAILSRLDARHLTFDFLFVAGMTADAVPGRQKMNIFFTEKERKIIGWRTHEDSVAEWRHLLAMLLVAAPRLEISWDGTIEDSPSVLVQEICDAFGVDWKAARVLPAKPVLDPPLSAREAALTWEARAARGVPLKDLPAPVSLPGASPRPRRERRTRILTSPERVETRLQSTREREVLPDLSRFDGLLNFASPALEPMRRVASKLGATACETYADCGWEAFVRNLADLEPLPELEATPLHFEQGRMIHKALAEAFDAAIGKPPLEIAPEHLRGLAADFADRLPEHRKTLRDSLMEQAGDFPDGDLFWRGRLGRLALGLDAPFDQPIEERIKAEKLRSIDSLFGALDNLVHFQVDRLREFFPRHVEAGIGAVRGCRHVLTPSAAALETPDGEGLVTRGVVDRIDLVPVEGKIGALVIDYKTGRAPSPQEIIEGYRFQLPLYLRAYAETVGRERGVQAAGAIYLGLKDDLIEIRGFALPLVAAMLHNAAKGDSPSRRQRGYRVKVDIQPINDMDAFLNACVANAANARRAAERGRFPTSWRPNPSCVQCQYRRICRTDPEAKRAWLSERRERLAELGLYDPEPVPLA